MATAKTRMVREAKRFKEKVIVDARSDLFGEASNLWKERGFPQKNVTVIIVGEE